MSAIMSTQSNVFDGIKQNMALAWSALPRNRTSQYVTSGVEILAQLRGVRDVEAVNVPLPPCKPLNNSERNEAEMLSRIRGALYSDDA